MANPDVRDPVLKLRGHHLICLPFIAAPPPRPYSAEFLQTEKRVKEILSSEPEHPVMVVEGPDVICPLCPEYVDGRCAAPQGDETETRKWDAILLRELGVTFGTCLPAGEWQARIAQKIPFKMCQRCKGRTVCQAGQLA